MLVVNDLQESAIKDAVFAAHIPFVICRLSPFEILYINQILKREWGFCTNVLLKEPTRITEIIYEEDRAEFIEKVMENPLNYCNTSIEFRMAVPEKQRRWYELRLYPLQIQPEITGLFGLVEDITERKQEQIALRSVHQKLKDYIHMIKHDLKGVMGNIKVVTQLIQDNISVREQQKVASYFDLMRKIFHSSEAFTENLSNKYLLGSEALPLELEEVDLVEEISNLVDLHRMQLKNKKLKMRVMIAEEEIKAMVDRVKFQQIVKNLLSNAIKFSHERGKVSLTLQELENDILLEVKDSGMGISLKDQPYIFEENSPAMRVGTKGEKPSGLGTYIAKRMVDLHRGKIWFESEEGSGTTFYVKLPKQVS